MKFSAREDIGAPADAVFSRLTDFDAHERAIMRRGVSVERLDTLTVPGPGMVWSGEVDFRNKRRRVEIELADLVPDELVAYRVDGSGLHGSFMIELLALSARRTRLSVALDLRPQSLGGRVLVQSLRLLKPNLTRRFRARVAEYAHAISRDLPGNDAT